MLKTLKDTLNDYWWALLIPLLFIGLFYGPALPPGPSINESLLDPTQEHNAACKSFCNVTEGQNFYLDYNPDTSSLVCWCYDEEGAITGSHREYPYTSLELIN